MNQLKAIFNPTQLWDEERILELGKNNWYMLEKKKLKSVFHHNTIGKIEDPHGCTVRTLTNI